MTGVDEAPFSIANGVAAVAAVAVVTVTGPYSWGTLVVGSLGLVAFFLGVFTARQAGVTAGAALVFLGVLLAGAEGAPGLVVLVGTVGTILAWDSASTALSLCRQLGRDAPTARLEGVRVATTGLVGAIAAGGVYGIYAVVAGEGTPTALVLSLFGVVLLVFLLR